MRCVTNICACTIHVQCSSECMYGEYVHTYMCDCILQETAEAFEKKFNCYLDEFQSSSFFEELIDSDSNEPHAYRTFTYDAIWTMAFALDSAEDGTPRNEYKHEPHRFCLLRGVRCGWCSQETHQYDRLHWSFGKYLCTLFVWCVAVGVGVGVAMCFNSNCLLLPFVYSLQGSVTFDKATGSRNGLNGIYQFSKFFFLISATYLFCTFLLHVHTIHVFHKHLCTHTQTQLKIKKLAYWNLS